MVITGASSGIGRLAALRFGRRGWRVGLIARGTAGLLSIERELGAMGAVAASAVADVADAAALEAAAAALDAALGPVTVWVNCAGNGVYGRLLDMSDAEFRRVTDVTYIGTVNGMRAALRRMVPRGAGVVVNVCSAIVFHGLPMLSSYTGAKAAVRSMTESVRHELVQDGSPVRLVVIYPPAVNTPFFSHALTYIPGTPRPAKPVYQPDIVAEAVVRAATAPRDEILVSGTTVLFALATRIVPGLVGWAVQRLGSAGQTTSDPAAARLHAPTLFTPSPDASGGYGAFGAEARRFSLQMWLTRRRGWVASGLGLLVVALLVAWLH